MKTIDYSSIKAFWQNRAQMRPDAGIEAVVNFEENEKKLREKIKLEQSAILPAMELERRPEVLDLGAGYGQWAMRFAPHVKRVTAVDYQEEMLSIGREISSKKGMKNIDFVCSPVEDFHKQQYFDRFFLSGILHYLDDALAEKLASNIASMSYHGSILVLREPTSILADRYVLDNVYSDSLKAKYSSLYRTAAEIQELFESRGFSMVKIGLVFPPGSGMDKFAETRLFLYQFKFNSPSLSL